MSPPQFVPRALLVPTKTSGSLTTCTALLRVALTAAVAAAIVLLSLVLRVGFADEYSYLFAISPLAATGRVLLSY